MSVRRPRAGEASALALIHIETWQHAYRGIFSDAFLDNLDVDRREKWFDVQIETGEGLLVADSGAGPVGFCSFGHSSDRGWGEVYAIYVHPDHWGRGHGHRLLSGAESHLADMSHRRALLWVLEENLRARAFYERQGWRLGRPFRIEDIGGTQVTEVRYECSL